MYVNLNGINHIPLKTKLSVNAKTGSVILTLVSFSKSTKY